MEPIKVILVDDEVEYITALSERLQMRGMETDLAFNGEKAIERVEEQDYDVMVLDLKMPGIDGLSVLKALNKSHPEIRVIIITGHGSDIEKDLAYQYGAFMYMQKPIVLEELIDQINIACAPGA